MIEIGPNLANVLETIAGVIALGVLWYFLTKD